MAVMSVRLCIKIAQDRNERNIVIGNAIAGDFAPAYSFLYGYLE